MSEDWETAFVGQDTYSRIMGSLALKWYARGGLQLFETL